MSHGRHPSMLKYSVALCTYNGEYFLPEQLDSILQQTFPPYEIVISDDKSADNTVSILEQYQHKHPQIIKNIKNKNNLGYTANFERAINNCTGDIIVIADQDDVWIETKLACFKEIFEKKMGVDLVFSDAYLVDEKLKDKGCRLWQAINFDKRMRTAIKRGDAFKILLKRNIVTGATMAFRASLWKFIAPINKLWVHDAWISIIISAIGNVYFISKPLIKYRQHSSNQIGARQKNLFYRIVETSETNKKEYYSKDLSLYEALLARIAKIPEDTISQEKKHMLELKIDHLKTRSKLPNNRLSRIPTILKELLLRRYSRYSSHGYKIALKDFLLK